MAHDPDRFSAALASRYRLERELGRGGMATVHLAEDLRHGRKVAIKVVHPEIARAIGPDRFRREIGIAARFNHPHIVPLFDSGEVDGELFYVMPYVTGESLRARLDREGALPLEDAVRIACEVASALGYAHRQEIVHRDVKPENILLSEDIALVADFGIAHAALEPDADAQTVAVTRVGALLGTPRYLSPEQAAGGAVDARSDLYALGCVLYEMLCGKPPFAAPTVEGLLRQHLSVEAAPVTEHRTNVPAGIALAVARALTKDPAGRFDSAAQFAEALALGSRAPDGTTLAPGASPHNLPRERTRFIGREKELAQCMALLADTRLLTLSGIGGSGKTRLALKLAEQEIPRFPDGVWFVDLAPLSEAGRVPSAVADVLGVREEPGTDVRDALARHLADRHGLLVLDNCEHVLEATGDLIDSLLASGDRLRILATSREGFGIEGERVLPLRSLSVPAMGSGTDRETIAAAESVRLFVDRARAADPHFAFDDRMAPVVAEICRRLDGIPLALELAAARVRILSVEQIRDRLDDRFRLLTGGSRSALARHQTLRATIQWSYDQLSPEEQALLRGLTVFAGGWTLELAAAVSGEGADEFTIMDGLALLVDKSLVLVERGTGTAPRYALLETVRQYAQEQLIEAGEADAAHERHAGAFIALAEQAYAGRIEREEAWSHALEIEHDNLRVALAALRDRAGGSERYLTLAGALAWFCQARSHLVEGLEHVMAALAAAAPDPPRPARARALWGAANLLTWQGGTAEAQAMMAEALRTWRELGDEGEIGLALEGMGWAQLLAGDDETSCATFEECVALQQRRGDAFYVNRALTGLAQTLVALHHVERARAVSEEILRFAAVNDDRRSAHSGHHFLADCDLIEGRFGEALESYRTSLGLARAIGDRLETSFEVQGMAMALAGLGDPEGALRLAGAVKAEWMRLGADPHMRFWDALLERHIEGARRALPPAAAERSWNEGLALPFDAACEAARLVRAD